MIPLRAYLIVAYYGGPGRCTRTVNVRTLPLVPTLADFRPESGMPTSGPSGTDGKPLWRRGGPGRWAPGCAGMQNPYRANPGGGHQNDLGKSAQVTSQHHKTEIGLSVLLRGEFVSLQTVQNLGAKRSQ